MDSVGFPNAQPLLVRVHVISFVRAYQYSLEYFMLNSFHSISFGLRPLHSYLLTYILPAWFLLKNGIASAWLSFEPFLLGIDQLGKIPLITIILISSCSLEFPFLKSALGLACFKLLS